MPATPHLGLPLIAAAQAQKHVTHNEALYGLDALVHLAVLRRDLATPPASPADGDRYLVAEGAVGAWAGRAGQVAAWQDGAWQDGAWAFHAPRRGWLAYVLDEGALLAWTGTSWAAAITALRQLDLDRLGLGTQASAATPFAAKLNQALWTALEAAEGGTGDLRLALNKEDAAGIVSLVLQSGYSGRAEIGLAGDDDLHLKVSADGAAWTEALRVDRASGLVRFPAGAAVPVAGRNRLLNGAFAVNQRGYASGTALAAGAYGFDRWRAGSGGATLAFTPAVPDTMVAITAGSLVQVVEDRNVEGGAYTLSWAGTAQGRIGLGAAPSGAYAASPVLVAGVGPGQMVFVEFSTGTLTRAQLEPGPVATSFERRPFGAELQLCERYAQVPGGQMGKWITTTSLQVSAQLRTVMRAAPSAAILAGAAGAHEFGIGTRAITAVSLAAELASGAGRGSTATVTTSAATSGAVGATLAGSIIYLAEL